MPKKPYRIEYPQPRRVRDASGRTGIATRPTWRNPPPPDVVWVQWDDTQYAYDEPGEPVNVSKLTDA